MTITIECEENNRLVIGQFSQLQSLTTTLLYITVFAYKRDVQQYFTYMFEFFYSCFLYICVNINIITEIYMYTGIYMYILQNISEVLIN